MFCSFCCPISSKCFPSETHLFEMSLIFCTFVCNHGALNLRLQVIASVTMARPTKTSQKLNIYRLDLRDRIF